MHFACSVNQWQWIGDFWDTKCCVNKLSWKGDFWETKCSYHRTYYVSGGTEKKLQKNFSCKKQNLKTKLMKKDIYELSELISKDLEDTKDT